MADQMPLEEERLQRCLQVLASSGFSLDGEPLKTLAFFQKAQLDAAVTGHVAEIGVAGGGFFAPLAACCREGELAFAIDVFEDGPNWNPSGGTSSLARLKGTLGAALGNTAAVRYISGDSLDLDPRDLLTEAGARFRFFSIDGAHSSHHTVNDLMIAGYVLAPRGIVWLDDIRNWGWPGVIDGFARYMLLNAAPRLVPFFLYSSKLLLTTPASHEWLLERAIALAHTYGREAEISYRVSDFFGHRVVGWN